MTLPIDLMAYQPWLGRQLESLADSEFIILNLALPTLTPAPEPKRLGIFGRRAKAVTTPFVQFLRTGERLISECGGVSAHDGELRSIGWVWEHPTHVYRRTWHLHDSPDTAAFAIRTLKLLGATRSEDIAFERNS